MKKRLIKPDNKQCKAVCKTVRVFSNNQPDTFIGRVRFYENGINLFNVNSGIVRLTELDAWKDAVDIAYENGFDFEDGNISG